MQPGPRRALALDLPLALGVGLVSWLAAEFMAMVGRLGEGSFENTPWERGGRVRPDFTVPSDAVPEVSWVIYPCLVLLVVALAGRRIRPRVAFLLVVLAVAGYLAAGGPYGPVLLAPALALHALATALPLPRWAPLTVLLVPMLVAHNWNAPYLGFLDAPFYGALVTGFAVMVVPALLGLLHRNRRDAERQDREQELRRYAYEERLQIAREVHDVVGHSLSVINLQAGVALHVLDRRPDEVETSLQAIRKTSREALDELRTTLAVFRNPAVDEPLAPRPGLARLDELVAALRAAGREVRVETAGADAETVPAAVDQAAYRIIQEALTNIVRHADATAALVSVQHQPQRLRLEISDAGPALAGPLVEGGGIRGMRERAEAVGGTLTLGPTPTGALHVRADLPVAGGSE